MKDNAKYNHTDFRYGLLAVALHAPLDLKRFINVKRCDVFVCFIIRLKKLT